MPEPAGRAREAAGREDVRRARRVVADDRRAADEHRAGVPDAREQERLRVGDVQLEMLGRVLLRARERLVERRDALDPDVGVIRHELARPPPRAPRRR